MTRKNIRITPKMVEALENTIEINGKSAMIMSHPKSQAALAVRRLADENGYLTDEGLFVAYLISLGSKARAWSQEELSAATRTWLRDRSRDVGKATAPKTIKRVVNGHPVEMPAHQEAAAYVAEVTAVTPEPCGAVDAGDLDACGGCSDCGPTPGTVTEYSVKIWYRSGAYEGVAHSPEELARKIFADVVKSAGVEFAELHGPSGMLIDSKPRVCGDVLLASRRLDGGPEETCVREPIHRGRHRSAPVMADGVVWENEPDGLTTAP